MRGFLSDLCKETFDKIANESEAVESFTKSFNALCAFAKAYSILFDKDPRAVMAEMLLEVFEDCGNGGSEDSDGACDTSQRPSDQD